MRRWSVVSFIGVALLALTALPGLARAASPAVAVHFAPVGDNQIRGIAVLRQLRDGENTSIRVVVQNLQPGHTYVSLYYDNDECALEPYSEEDVIGGPYTANAIGGGRTTGEADDPLEEIHSVSVRDAVTFELLACAVVSPDED
jgi:hypothetical protein